MDIGYGQLLVVKSEKGCNVQLVESRHFRGMTVKETFCEHKFVMSSQF